MGAKENFDFIRDLQSVSAKLVTIVSNAVSSATQTNGPASTPSSTPRHDIVVTPGDLLVMLDLPGVRKEDIQVTVGSDGVTVVGQSRKPEIEGGTFVRQNRRYGTFTYTFALPGDVEVDLARAHASFSDGVLTITVSRILPEAAEPAVSIPIL